MRKADKASTASGDGVQCVGGLTFEPVVGEDGKPLAFDYTNTEFAGHMCPTIRMAFMILGMTQERVGKLVNDLIEEDPEGDILMDLVDNLGIVDERLRLIAGFAKAAQARLLAMGLR